MEFYENDLNSSLLSAPLQNICKLVYMAHKGERYFCIKAMQEMSTAIFSTVCTMARLILIMPATNAVGEYRFSS